MAWHKRSRRTGKRLFASLASSIGLLLAFSHAAATAAVLVETQLPGVAYIGQTDSAVPDPANAVTNAAAVSSVGSVSLSGAMTAYTHLVSGGNVIVTNLYGQMLRVIDASGRSIGVNPTATPVTKVTDPAGNVMTYTYDGAGRTVKTERSTGGNVTTYGYDSSNRVTQSTNPTGNVITYGYDTGNNRLQTTTEPGGLTTQYQYDSADRPIKTIDQAGRATTYTYDGTSNRLQGSTADPPPSTDVTTFTYDGLNRLSTRTDPAGNITTYTYDSNSLLISQQMAPAGLITTYTYDGLNRLIKRTDPDTAFTTYTYDGAGRMIERDITPASVPSSIYRYSYDTAGRLASITDPGGGATTLTYVPELTSIIVWTVAGLTLLVRRRY
jgi:YD repeat-containing protein